MGSPHVDWAVLSRDTPLTENVIRSLKDNLDWSIIAEFRSKVDWNKIYRKRMFDFTDNDEDDILIAPKRIKRTPDNHTKPKYDLDLSSKDSNGDKSIPHYAINLGKRAPHGSEGIPRIILCWFEQNQ
ncbi:hypothetical protein CDAR_293681 [Caerostris darwini]|uniref:Uncharacterized protein n=1 Tax=Caerostris darwini TaxID=1538125 RepID=A0AAV4TQM7_9ARAC|nr:hypothetical protein CDAR_293681 [Caerostris darwini]